MAPKRPSCAPGKWARAHEARVKLAAVGRCLGPARRSANCAAQCNRRTESGAKSKPKSSAQNNNNRRLRVSQRPPAWPHRPSGQHSGTGRKLMKIKLAHFSSSPFLFPFFLSALSSSSHLVCGSLVPLFELPRGSLEALLRLSSATAKVFLHCCLAPRLVSVSCRRSAHFAHLFHLRQSNTLATNRNANFAHSRKPRAQIRELRAFGRPARSKKPQAKSRKREATSAMSGRRLGAGGTIRARARRRQLGAPVAPVGELLAWQSGELSGTWKRRKGANFGGQLLPNFANFCPIGSLFEFSFGGSSFSSFSISGGQLGVESLA